MATLTAAQLVEYRNWLHDQAQLAMQHRRTARTDRQREQELVRFQAYSAALFHLDELLADVVTVRLVEPDEAA